MKAPGESGTEYEEDPLRITLSVRFDTQIAICSAAGITATMAAPLNEADSADVYYQPNSGAGWVVPNSLVGLYINVETQVIGTTPASVPGWDVNPFGENALDWYRETPNGSFYMYFPGVTSGTFIGNLTTGTTVGSSASFNTSQQISNTTFGSNAGQWKLNASNYLGFSFVGADAGTHYGWLRIDVGASAGIRTIMEVSYSTIIGQSVIVGQGVPEPSTVIMGLLATGATGVIAWRRRRQTA